MLITEYVEITVNGRKKNHYDFFEFVERIDKGEFNDWFETNNLPININYEYMDYILGVFDKLCQTA